MAQYLANIDLASLDGSNGFKLSGEAANDYSGYSVASGGDVNGDGFADLIVGARGAHPRNSGAGYVVFGKGSGFASNIDLAKLDGRNGFKLSGVAAGDFTGSSVASAGDVNGDGIDDLIVGARHADAHGTYSGASYVVFGKTSGFAANLDLSSLDGSSGFKLSGVAADDRTGDSVSSAGDVNGDGFADLIVGAFLADAHGDRSGASYVVFGKASGFAANLDLSDLNGSNGFRLSGEAAGDWSGMSVSAGDVNGDGFADLIVGAGLADPHGTSSGASYVVFGKPSGFTANFELSSLDGSNGFKVSGAAGGDISGRSVASAGDVNGDGFADLIIGAMEADPHGRDSGASYVVFGKGSGSAGNIDLSSLDGSNGFKLSGVAAWDRSGFSVASAGDVNGDGFADVIIGATWADAHGSYDTGASYVVFGKGSGFAANLNLSKLDGSNGFKLSGVAAYDESGYSVASAGDVNGDGFGDLIVGAWAADPHGDRSGATYVVYGRAPDSAVNRIGTVASQALAGGAFDDTLSGLGGDDRLFGNAGNDALDGGLGNDAAYGGDGNDLVRGREGDDVLSGGAGDDELFGAEGNDIVDGGGGNDTLAGGEGNDRLNGGKGIDTVRYFSASAGVAVDLALTCAQNTGGAGIDTLRNVENVAGSDFGDHLLGSDGANVLTGGAEDDVLIGRNGNDTLDGGTGNDWADYGDKSKAVTVALAGAANALVTVEGIIEDIVRNVENVKGGSGNDKLLGDGLSNILEGGKGNDILDGVNGSDTLIGGRGDDTYLNDGGDTIIEDAGGGIDMVRSSVSVALGANLENLVLTGSAAIDGTGNGLANVMSGNAAANRLFGGEGNDILRGGAGDDSISGGPGDDTLDGGDGIDQARYASSTTGVTVSLAISGPQDTGAAGVDTLVGIENLLGSKFGDVLSGDSKANTLSGNGGNDRLTGAGGNDTFQFDTPLVAGGFTTIADFAADMIALARAVFTQVGAVGSLEAGRFVVGDAAHDATDRVIYNAASGALLYDPDGTGSQAATHFATVAPGLALSAGDFRII